MTIRKTLSAQLAEFPPRPLPTNFDGILPELKEVPNWVLAKYERRDGRWTKPPYQPNGFPASHSNPRTWNTFDDVRSVFHRGGYIGVGFVLDGKPHFDGRYLYGMDWDKCIEDFLVDPIVKTQVKRLNFTRVELSISGTGLRGFSFVDAPRPSRRTRIDGRSVEFYFNQRFLITTGLAFQSKLLR